MPSTIRQIFGRTGFDPVERPRYGVEVEVEGAGMGVMAPTGWDVTTDGSLRNGGLEFRSRSPWLLDTCLRRGSELYEVIDRNALDTNVRCGIHVHVNCLDYTPEQVGGILATYCIVEPLLFKMCGDTREQNNYCVPWYRAYDDASLYVQAMFGLSGPSGVRSACKYSALFIEPLRRFGTIEFRQAPTWQSYGEYEEWLKVVDAIVQYGRTRDAEAVLEEYNTLGSDQWLVAALGDSLDSVLFHVEGIAEDVIDHYDSVYGAEILAQRVSSSPWPEGMPGAAPAREEIRGAEVGGIALDDIADHVAWEAPPRPIRRRNRD